MLIDIKSKIVRDYTRYVYGNDYAVANYNTYGDVITITCVNIKTGYINTIAENVDKLYKFDNIKKRKQKIEKILYD